MKIIVVSEFKLCFKINIASPKKRGVYTKKYDILYNLKI